MRQSAFVLAILGCLSATAAAQTLPVSDHYFTTSDGMKLHYAKLGKTGSPVILIHGSGGAARTWLENGVAQALAKNHIVIVANMRGHGLSQGPRDGDMPLDVIELMDHLKIERAHIHGFSMGGSILAQLMARVPQRIITAVFGGSGVREPEDLAAKVPSDAKGTDPDSAKIRARTHRLWRELRNFQMIRLPGKEHLTSVYPGTIPKEYIEGLARFIDANDIARSAS